MLRLPTYSVGSAGRPEHDAKSAHPKQPSPEMEYLMHALAKNATFEQVASGGTVRNEGAKDCCFIFINCDTAKVQGKAASGDAYADLAGSGTPFGPLVSGTNIGVLSLTDCQYDYLSPVLTGSGATAIFIRTGLRDYTASADFSNALRVQIDDILQGTA